MWPATAGATSGCSRLPRGRLLLLAALATSVAGCGLGAGDAPSGVGLTVTDRFGAKVLVLEDAAKVSGEETVMRLLQRNAKVRTRFGGNFVQSIKGVAGGQDAGRPVDWFFFVNGEEAGKGATAIK